MKTMVRALVAGAVLSVSVSSFAAPVYLRSTVGAPWGQSTNEAAMDVVFGAGNWTDGRYETVNTATLFSAGTNFIFMEGGDSNADELEAFLGANGAAISGWVNAGGRLLLNAAPNEGNGMSFGFGVSLNYPDFGAGNCASHAVNPANPIFSGIATNYTGNSFCHATVSGGGLSAIIADDSDNDTVLGEMAIGSGLALFGGMTTTNFHSPQPDATTLREHIIAYAVNGAVNRVPVPGVLALCGIGFLGILISRRRG